MKRLVIWGITLSVITLSLLGAGVYFLYNASYERQARQLQDAVSNRAALIQSVARFDRENLPDTSDFANPGGQGPKAATFHVISSAIPTDL